MINRELLMVHGKPRWQQSFGHPQKNATSTDKASSCFFGPTVELVSCDVMDAVKKTKHDLALEMLRSAKDRKITARAVMFDSWYAAGTTMKAIRKLGWHWITELKCNRKLNGMVRVEQRWKTTYGSVIATRAGGYSSPDCQRRQRVFCNLVARLEAEGGQKSLSQTVDY